MKRALIYVIAISCLLIAIFPFFQEYSDYKQSSLELRNVNLQPWVTKAIFSLLIITIALYIAAKSYVERLREKIDTIEIAVRIKVFSSVAWWTLITCLFLFITWFLAKVYRHPSEFLFTLIKSMPITIFFVYILLTEGKELKYYRMQPSCNIMAAGLLEQHSKFLKEHDFAKAYVKLSEACEIAPDGVELWCRLAFFCETIRKNSDEADKYMAKAKELIETKKTNSNGDKACYLNYLGVLLYERGDYDKGLDYIKQSIEIEPRPARISLYEKRLAEWNEKKQTSRVSS